MPSRSTKERSIALQTKFGHGVFRATILSKQPTSSRCGTMWHVPEKAGSNSMQLWRRHELRIGSERFAFHQKTIGLGPFSNASNDYNAADYWAKVTVPVFVMYGEKDLFTPVSQSISNIDQALKKAGNKDYTIIV